MSSGDKPNFAASLPESEAAQLAAGLATLSNIGLPLPAGLRALAEEWPSRRLRPVLLELANRVEQGVSLEEAITSIGAKLPAHLRGLIVIGVRSGRLAEVLEQYAYLQRMGQELKRRVLVGLAYPFLLLLLMLAINSYCAFFVRKQMFDIFFDFRTHLPLLTRFFMGIIGPFTWVLLILAILLVMVALMLIKFPGSRCLLPLAYKIPVIGSMLKCRETARFSRFMELLVGQQVPLPDSLRLTANGLDDVYLARACKKVALDVEGGRSLSASIAASGRFAPEILPLVKMGERTTLLSDAFQSSGEIFENMAALKGQILKTTFLPLMYIFILCFYVFFVLAMFMPFISLITRLSGGY